MNLFDTGGGHLLNLSQVINVVDRGDVIELQMNGGGSKVVGQNLDALRKELGIEEKVAK